MTDSVFVRGLEFEGNHGYTAAERRGTRRFRVNLTLELPLAAAAASDKIADTVDYWKVSEIAVSIGTKSTFKLLEALAGAIGAKIQELYPQASVAARVGFASTSPSSCRSAPRRRRTGSPTPSTTGR